MYYPYVRGKQYELITLRDNATILAESNFVPIIEPVKSSLGSLQRALDAIRDAGASAILIVNPHHGDHSPNADAIDRLVRDDLHDHASVAVGIALSEASNLAEIEDLLDAYAEKTVTLVHAGFAEGRQLSDRLADYNNVNRHVFFDEHCGKLYQRHFRDHNRVLLKDGFIRRRNKDHPPVEFFSDLHATFADEGMDGFGDFLIVGDDYSESGGPAYAVAIHLTFVDPDRDGEMHIFHFVSERQDTPTDPAGKFAESLDKLVAEVNRPGSHLLRTDAVEGFLDLHTRGHYPGLGYLKKLSMQHHIETMAHFFRHRP